MARIAMIAVLLALLSATQTLGQSTAASRAPAMDAQALAVLSSAKAATGGAAWDQIAGWRESGRHGGTDYETLLDFRRYGARFANTRDGKTRVHGFNGSVVWDQGPDGKVTVTSAPASLAEARQSAYFSSFAFFLPARFPARFEYLGVQSDDGGSFDVVRVTPPGATSVEVWVDRTTHLPERFVDRSAPRPAIARLSDYRPIGAVRQPFRIDSSDGDPSHTQTLEVDKVVLEPVDRSAFDPPQ